MERVNTYSKPSVISLLWKLVVMTFAVIGVYLQAKLDGGLFSTNVYLYFTILSNMGTAALCLVCFVMGIAERCVKRPLIPRGLYALKYMFTIAMTITLVVSLCLLAPFKSQAYLFSLRNLSVHIFAPFGAVVDFLAFDKRFRCRMRTCFAGFVVPAVYLAVTLLLSIKGISYSNGTNFPYYFLDYRTLGWLNFETGKIGVVWWIALIAIITLVVSLLLTSVKIVVDKCRR